jgi:hypothetical protein
MEPMGLDARICDGTIIRRASIFVALALLSGHVFAQDVPQPGANPSKPDASQPVDEVIVRGRRMSELRVELEKFVLEFVNKVTAPAAGRGYARWQRFLCVGVNNLRADAAQYIVDRISKEALELGLEPGEPGCQPEVIVIFTTDAKQLATFLVKHYKRAFLPGMGEGGMARNRDALDAFTQTDKPVRWWATSMPVDARVGTAAVTVPGTLGGPAYASDSGGGSRIHNMTVDAMRQVIIIVDGTKLHGTTWEQLGDYLAVVSLAQIRLETDPVAFDSILNLFSNPKAYSGLTDWDRTYLKTLYSNDQERVPAMQKVDLINRMTYTALGGE